MRIVSSNGVSSSTISEYSSLEISAYVINIFGFIKKNYMLHKSYT